MIKIQITEEGINKLKKDGKLNVKDIEIKYVKIIKKDKKLFLIEGVRK